MADENKPWEKYGTGQSPDGPQSSDEGQQAAPSGGNKPWEKYGNAHAVTTEEMRRDDIADAYATAAEAKAEEMSGLEKTADWFGDVARATFFGPIADPIAAQIISWQQGEDVSYAEAYDAIKAHHKATNNTSANIVGAVVGGGVLAKGAAKALDATAKTGYAKGAVQYLRRDKKWNKFLGNTAAGGAIGALEEGIRVGLEETFDATAGLGFEADRFGESVVMGALIGGAAGNAAEFIRGAAKHPLDFLKRIGGGETANWQKASRDMLKEYRGPNETIEEAGARFQKEVMQFQHKNGRLPAAGEILKPEQIRNMSEAIRMHNGLDIRARELGEDMVDRVVKEYDEVVTRGRTVASPEAVDVAIEDAFTDFMTMNGKSMVPVSTEVADALAGNRKVIEALTTSESKGAARLGAILDSKRNISGVRRKITDVLAKSDSANRKAKLDVMREELAEELNTLFNEAGADASRVAELRNAIQLQKAIDDAVGSKTAADLTDRQLEELRPTLMRMESELKNFEENGLLISLSDANDIRRMASSAFNMARRGDNAFEMNRLRQVRDTVAEIGVNEVPEYRRMVRMFNLESLRSEAMDTGRAGARGDVILEDLAARIKSGRATARAPRQDKARQRASVQRGVREGMRLELNQAVRKGGKEGVRAAVRLANSPQAKDSVASVMNDMDAKELTRQAQRVKEIYENMGMLTGARSPSELAQELETASDIATGALFGNIGGAARVGLFKKILRDFQMPRGTAEKVVDMLGDPATMPKALEYMQSKGIRIAPLYAAIAAHLASPVPNTNE